MAGFWARLEQWLIELQKDRGRMARYLQYAYWVSLLFVLVGFAFILLIYTGRWTP